LSLGATHFMSTFIPFMEVTGGSGWLGLVAARIETSFEYPTLKSNSFLDFTLKVYVMPRLKP